jgi:hypothetical protein
MQPEAEVTPAPEVKVEVPVEVKPEERKSEPERKLMKEDFTDILSVEDLAQVLQTLLYAFKISGITITLKPRTTPPITSGG